ncbi:hypothetical protein C4571_03135 [Candidatus Parcubacteria bacterium]|nr:MAG: hypothetical protein C4571_03135 [Candidatus Parcubacteria bacterium]
MEYRGFLHKIQSADEPTKRKWVVVFSTIAMALVVYVWLAYFNNLIGNSVAPASNEPVQEEPTFFDAVRRGSAILYEGFKGKIQDLGGILKAPREYIIQPPR